MSFIELYKTFVRPHYIYYIKAWAPWTAGDKEVLELVQRRAVGMGVNPGTIYGQYPIQTESQKACTMLDELGTT